MKETDCRLCGHSQRFHFYNPSFGEPFEQAKSAMYRGLIDVWPSAGGCVVTGQPGQWAGPRRCHCMAYFMGDESHDVQN